MGRKPTGTVYLARGRWRAQFTHEGKRCSLPVPDRRDGRPITEDTARAFLETILGRIARGEYDPSKKTIDATTAGTVAEYVLAWVKEQTHATQRDDQRRVERYVVGSALGRMPLREVRPKHVADFLEAVAKRDSRRGDKLGGRTVRNIFSVLQRAFARAVLAEVFEVSPCAVVAQAGLLPDAADKDPTARAEWIYTTSEVEALCASAEVPPDRRVLYALLALTGARFGEAAALRWRDYDASAKPLGRITIARSSRSSVRQIVGTKTGAIRRVPVHPELAKVLAAWKAEGWASHYRKPSPEPNDLIVPNKLGKARGVSAAHQALGGDLRRLGFAERGQQQHALRRTFVSLARDGGARGDLLRWVTHTPPRASLDQYTTPSWSSLCEEVAKIRVDLDSARNSARTKE